MACQVKRRRSRSPGTREYVFPQKSKIIGLPSTVDDCILRFAVTTSSGFERSSLGGGGGAATFFF